MLLPEGGEVVAQHAVGKRKGADAQVHDAPINSRATYLQVHARTETLTA